MDQDERDLWNAKLSQKREIRKQAYARCIGERAARNVLSSGITPSTLYDVAIDNLGDLNIMWRDVIQGSWQRPVPEPDSKAAEEKAEIRQIIHEEQGIVHAEILDLLTKKGLDHGDGVLASGRQKLASSSNVLEKRCLVLVENLRLEKAENISREWDARRDRLIDRGISLSSLVIGGLIAIVSVWLTNYLNRETLESHIAIELGEPSNYGPRELKDNVFSGQIKNIGPNDVKDVQLFLTSFYATPGMDQIKAGPHSLIPLLNVAALQEGKVSRFALASSESFKWQNFFLNEKVDRKQDKDLKGKALFIRVAVNFRRKSDSKSYNLTQVYHASPNTLILWNFPRTTDEYLGTSK